MTKYLEKIPIDVYIYLGQLDDDSNNKLLFGTDVIESRVNNLLYVINDLVHIKKINICANNTVYELSVTKSKIACRNVDKSVFIDQCLIDNVYDDLKTKKFFLSENVDLKILLTLELLKSFHYISAVVVQVNEQEFAQGFQLNAGLLRKTQTSLF